jgi:TatD DNase family protein
LPYTKPSNCFIKNSNFHKKDDVSNVLERAFANHVEKIIITGTSLTDSAEVLALANTNPNLFITVGCHPTRSNEFEQNKSPQHADDYFQSLLKLVQDNPEKVVAIGECGLDYDRTHFSPKWTQKKYFDKQLELPKLTKKPLFLHCRNAYADFGEILKKHHADLHGGVVHSFTGTKEEAKMFTDMGYFIGINGCSLKTQENIDAMCSIPKEFLMIETGWQGLREKNAKSFHLKFFLPE